MLATALLFMSLADDKATGETWLFRYQTLLTGIFAIGAAFVTVKQMQKTDEQSERRHQELARLQVRAEKLKIERMLLPQFQQLRLHYKELLHIQRKEKGNFLDWLEDGEVPHDQILRAADELVSVGNDLSVIREILDRVHWRAAADLFGGELQFAEERLKKRLDIALLAFRRLENLAGSEFVLSEKDWGIHAARPVVDRTAIIEAYRGVNMVVGGLDKLFPHLFRLADLYQVQV